MKRFAAIMLATLFLSAKLSVASDTEWWLGTHDFCGRARVVGQFEVQSPLSGKWLLAKGILEANTWIAVTFRFEVQKFTNLGSDPDYGTPIPDEYGGTLTLIPMNPTIHPFIEVMMDGVMKPITKEVTLSPVVIELSRKNLILEGTSMRLWPVVDAYVWRANFDAKFPTDNSAPKFFFSTLQNATLWHHPLPPARANDTFGYSFSDERRDFVETELVAGPCP